MNCHLFQEKFSVSERGGLAWERGRDDAAAAGDEFARRGRQKAERRPAQPHPVTEQLLQWEPSGARSRLALGYGRKTGKVQTVFCTFVKRTEKKVILLLESRLRENVKTLHFFSCSEVC